jgi:putative pyruvate formate lyase activating enzyme
MDIAGRRLYQSGLLRQRIDEARRYLEECTLCPRNCRVNRLHGELGRCGTGEYARIASYGSHFGEEQPLVGENGSGTIFLSSCNLRCCFCQNYEISHHPEESPEVDDETFGEVMLTLQKQGCHNINLVTPTHVVPAILSAVNHALAHGLCIPVVYNCSGYESLHALALLDGVVDIYLADFKFWDPDSGEKYADAPDYPEIARAALPAMHRQVGDLRLDEHGVAKRGLLIRHLLMPGGLAETREILRFIAAELGDGTYVNIMDQYRPRGSAATHHELMGEIEPDALARAAAMAEGFGLTRLDKRDLSALLRRLLGR